MDKLKFTNSLEKLGKLEEVVEEVNEHDALFDQIEAIITPAKVYQPVVEAQAAQEASVEETEEPS